MDLFILLKGLAIGVAVAAPVGPVGFFCIHRCLNDGFWAGFVAGWGAAVADGLFAWVAAFGWMTLTQNLTIHQSYLKIVGGLIFLVFGFIAFFNGRQREVPVRSTKGMLADALITLVLTLSNPFTVLALLAFFASMSLDTDALGKARTGLLVGGVFLGSLLWWFLLCRIALYFKSRMKMHHLKFINRLVSVLIIVFGVIILAEGFWNGS